MDEAETYEDAYNLLCGKLVGEGIHRMVFSCRLRPDLVVKVESTGGMAREFANVHEMKVWCDNEYHTAVSRWLAPCVFMSPDGRILLQHRVIPLSHADKLPATLPAFLTDIKRENFGWLGGQLVCMDYSLTTPTMSLRHKKVNWDD